MPATIARPRSRTAVHVPGDDEFRECRTLGHAMFRFQANDLDRPDFGWRLSVRCERCSTQRHDIIDHRTGSIIGRRYIWPDGYLLEPGLGRTTRDEMRESLFERLRKELDEHNAISTAMAERDNALAVKSKSGTNGNGRA